MLEKYMKTLREALGEQYYFIVTGGSYTKEGHYWNSDIHAYTPEGDEQIDVDGWKSDVFDSWDDLCNALDDELLLSDKAAYADPETLTPTEKDGVKVLMEYDITKYEVIDDEDEEGRGDYWEGDVSYTVQICEV